MLHWLLVYVTDSGVHGASVSHQHPCGTHLSLWGCSWRQERASRRSATGKNRGRLGDWMPTLLWPERLLQAQEWLTNMRVRLRLGWDRLHYCARLLPFTELIFAAREYQRYPLSRYCSFITLLHVTSHLMHTEPGYDSCLAPTSHTAPYMFAASCGPASQPRRSLRVIGWYSCCFIQCILAILAALIYHVARTRPMQL